MISSYQSELVRIARKIARGLCNVLRAQELACTARVANFDGSGSSGLGMSWLLVIWAGCIAATTIVWGAESRADRRDETQKQFGEFDAAHEKAVAVVLRTLQEREMWTHAENHKMLLRCLETARRLRIEKAAPLLVGHIAFSPATSKETKGLQTMAQQWPAYGVLVEIGLPSVPFLLAEMKKGFGWSSPEALITVQEKAGEYEDSLRRPYLLASCLEAIYDEAGHGTVLAKKRVELELAATKDKEEKANLQAALDHPIFNGDKAREEE